MAFLELSGVTVNFGGLNALSDISMRAERGQVTGLIGPNGAGKTTLFNVISGVQPPTHGHVLLDGRDISSVPAHRRARLGIARTFQRLELFSTLSVRDNVRVALDAHRSGGRRRHADARVDELLERVGASDVDEARADELPTGTARLVELARALATAPKVLLLDEPASGLDEHETSRFGDLLVSLADDGLTVVLVEHDAALVMRTCNPVCVLDFGQVIACGTPSEVQQDPRVLEAYLGV